MKRVVISASHDRFTWHEEEAPLERGSRASGFGATPSTAAKINQTKTAHRNDDDDDGWMDGRRQESEQSMTAKQKKESTDKPRGLRSRK